MWTAAFNFLLALLIFGFNLLVLIAIASERRLHSTTNLLSTNLWLCNCISAIVTVFFSLNPNAHYLEQGGSLPCASAGGSAGAGAPAVVASVHSGTGNVITGHHANTNTLVDADGHLYRINHDVRSAAAVHRSFTGLEMYSAHSSAVLLNSTVSLLTLLTMGVVHALKRHNYHLSTSQSSRLLASTWFLVVLLLLTDFFLIRVTRSFLLAVPFHLALLSVFLVLNLIVHPLNLLMLSRCRVTLPEPERSKLVEESATAALWLLLNSLSFIIIAMMVVWESKTGKDTMESIMGIEMAAYSVHCVANPLIAVIRDRHLECALARILLRSKRQTTDEELVIALMRDPPPPYSTIQL